MNIISFSLWGDNPKYVCGAIKNIKLREKIYPEWEMHFYHNDTVPKDALDTLSANGAVLINMDSKDDVCNAMWRFLPASNENINYFISRDCDSRVNERELSAVNEWIESGKSFHIIRDHPHGHAWKISAGMWGCKGGFIKNIDEKMKNYLEFTIHRKDRAVDQHFLQEIIYPTAITDLCLHDEYFNYEGIGRKIKRDRMLDDFAFVGEPFDEDDKQLNNYRDVIIQRY